MAWDNLPILLLQSHKLLANAEIHSNAVFCVHVQLPFMDGNIPLLLLLFASYI